MREILFDGPGKNALSTALMRSAVDRIKEADGAPLLLRGQGDSFSAGLNLKEIATLDAKGLEHFLRTLDELVVTLYNHPAPVVADVNGHAIAGGCIVAMCADIRVATAGPSARIGLNEVAIGLEFPQRIMKLARARIPAGSLDRVLLEGGLYSPDLARHLCLVDEVSDDPARPRQVLEVLASHPREAYRRCKETLRAGVLDLTEAEERDFSERLLPYWVARKEELVKALGR